MIRRKKNEYIEYGDTVFVKCSNTSDVFIIDKKNIDKVKKYIWWFHKNNIAACINGCQYYLGSYLLNNVKSGNKVLRLNNNSLDFREKNLWVGNTYTFYEDRVEGKCFDGSIYIIDTNDYETVSSHKWHVVTDPRNGYISLTSKINGNQVKMHRFLLGLSDPKIEVDHINHNTLDNRRNNIRIVNRSQNQMNTRAGSANKSGVKGVYKGNGFDKWCA